MRITISTINFEEGREIDFAAKNAPEFNSEGAAAAYLEQSHAGWTSVVAVLLPDDPSKNIKAFVLKDNIGRYFKGPGKGWGLISIEHAFIMDFGEASLRQTKCSAHVEIVEVKLVMSE